MMGFGIFRRGAAPEASASQIKKATRSAGRGRGGPVSRVARGFDAAVTDRLTAGWTTTPMTADQVIDRNQRVLVARSREAAQKNDYMRSFLRLCAQNIVGHRGFALQAQVRLRSGDLDQGANEALETWWKTWQRHCDITGTRSFRRLCQAAILSAAKDGEFMIREITGRAAGPMGYALQIIDPQRCPVDYTIERMPGGRFVRHGIEFSREGRPLAYYFMTGDPALSGYTFNGHSLDRVPADEIIHGYLEDVIGQRRGLPWAATSLWRLHMLGGFEKAALSSARTGASLGGFFEWKEGYGPEPAEGEVLEDEELYIEAEGGVFQELPPGAEVREFKTQYPTGEFAPFHKAMLRGAGAGMGVAYVSFANDLEGVNFSSIRQGVIDERDHWMDLQEWLIETLIDRCYRGALSQSLLRGLVTHNGIRLRPEGLDRYLNVYWQGRRWAWVDPLKDMKAEKDSVSALFSAPSDVIRRRGDDPDTVWKQYAADIKAMQAAGVPDDFIMAAVLGTPPGNGTPPPDPPDDE